MWQNFLMWFRLALNSCTSYLRLKSVVIIGICHGALQDFLKIDLLAESKASVYLGRQKAWAVCKCASQSPSAGNKTSPRCWKEGFLGGDKAKRAGSSGIWRFLWRQRRRRRRRQADGLHSEFQTRQNYIVTESPPPPRQTNKQTNKQVRVLHS